VIGVVGFLVVASPAAHGATVSLKAVKRNDTVITPANTVAAAPGDRITAEVYISGWNADLAGSQLRTYQYTIRGGFSRDFGCPLGEAFYVLPCGFDLANEVFCETDLDCPQDIAPACPKPGVCNFPCTPNGATPDACDTLPDTEPCPAELPCCDSTGECVGPDHMPDAFTMVDTNHSNPDFVFKNFQPAIAATSFRNYADIAQGGTTINSSGPTDTGQPYYAGTICLEILPNACGSIVVPFIDDPDGISTFLALWTPAGGTILVYPMFQYLTINTTVPCPSAPQTVSTDPPNCEIDARAPHQSESQTPPLGERVFQLTFDRNMVACTNDQFLLSFVPPISVGSPTIESIQNVGSEVTFTLDRPPPTAGGAGGIPVPRWTCITFTGGVPGQNKRCWGHFPGDVDDDSSNDTSDLETLVGLIDDPTPPLHHCDLDYSGLCTPADIIEWIDMANGGGAFGPWLNTTLLPCPSAGQ